MDTTAMNKDVSNEVWVDASKSLLKQESLPPESDEVETSIL
jgi:hypothetical protein